MTNHIKILLTTSSFLLLAAVAHAQAQPAYPIPELGDCRDARECYLYCEIPRNKAACWSYEKYILHSQVRTSQSDQDIAQQYNITFPIAKLGSCGSVDECRAYCEAPANHAACENFARQHGLGEAGEEHDMLEAAKRELGCNSMEECQTFCSDPANQSRCLAFAEKYAPSEYHQRQDEMLSRAREHLGCDSFESCQALCQNPDNLDRCSSFAESYAPEEFKQRQQEFVEKVGQNLPCNSFATCRAYCEANPAACQQSIDDAGTYHIEMRQEESFTCDTPEQCQAYCQQNPEACPGYTGSSDYERYQQPPPQSDQNPSPGAYPSPQPEDPTSSSSPASHQTSP